MCFLYIHVLLYRLVLMYHQQFPQLKFMQRLPSNPFSAVVLLINMSGFLDFDATHSIARAAYYKRYCPVSSPPSQPVNDPVRIHSKRFISPAYFRDF
ncbi:hypothetical protein CEXT_276751 [Caerostris extrusa]|uniref:Uncharacterized protein n=1 Tax=Caerostris extrusa TaxID=172846 RepID=A0AAV4QL01_CAEEX|nr:hypothetical protein CEXT_276751 [Caerostris extrusa]